MSKRREIYYSKNCGITLETLGEGGELECCGEKLEKLVGNTTEAAVEKHIPVIEAIEGGYKVVVGSVEHPMTEEHLIEWIELNEDDKVQIKFLNPGDKPVAEFKTDAKNVSARAFCNLHGLWKSE